jgi:hypothetical protein
MLIASPGAYYNRIHLQRHKKALIAAVMGGKILSGEGMINLF